MTTQTPLSRTAAIREARKHVTLSAHGIKQYVVYQPHRFDNLSGPNTCGQPRDYFQARVVYVDAVATLALYLMGFRFGAFGDDIDNAIIRARTRGLATVNGIVVWATDWLKKNP